MNGIVVGVEESPEGTAALEWALREAVLRGVPLLAVRVWIDHIAAGYPVGAVLVGADGAAEAQAVDEAEGLLRQVTPRVPGADGAEIRVMAMRGAAGPVLAQVARDQAMLVVGTRSANAFSRVVLGSVSVYALHHAQCPVAVIPAPRAGSPRPGRVLVGVDHSHWSLSALSWAADAARHRHAVLAPVLAREGNWARSAKAYPVSLTQLEASERRTLIDAVPAGASLVVEPEIVAGPAGKELVRLAEPQDLLVVGTRGHGSTVGMLLGSTSIYVAEHAHCPVVVVRNEQHA